MIERDTVGRPSFRPGETGAAALELALMLPFLSLLLVGAVDVARHAALARELAEAAERAAAAAGRTPAAGSLPAGRLARPNSPAAADGWAGTRGLTGKTRIFAGCPGRLGVWPAHSGRCPDGTSPLPFAEVRVDASIMPLMPWPEALLARRATAYAVVPLG